MDSIWATVFGWLTSAYAGYKEARAKAIARDAAAEQRVADEGDEVVAALRGEVERAAKACASTVTSATSATTSPKLPN